MPAQGRMLGFAKAERKASDFWIRQLHSRCQDSSTVGVCPRKIRELNRRHMAQNLRIPFLLCSKEDPGPAEPHMPLPHLKDFLLQIPPGFIIAVQVLHNTDPVQSTGTGLLVCAPEVGVVCERVRAAAGGRETRECRRREPLQDAQQQAAPSAPPMRVSEKQGGERENSVDGRALPH